MVKDGRFKLIEYVVNGQRTTQLFDLEEDPDECCNLAGDGSQADRVQELRHHLFRWRDDWDDDRQRVGKGILGRIWCLLIPVRSLRPLRVPG